MVQGGSWNVNLCSFYFRPEILLRIKAIPTPQTANHKDSWGLSPFGEFEGKSTCGLEKEGESQIIGSQDNGFGKLTLPKIQFYV